MDGCLDEAAPSADWQNGLRLLGRIWAYV